MAHIIGFVFLAKIKRIIPQDGIKKMMGKNKPIEKPKPRILRETKTYRIVSKPYEHNGKWIDQLIIERRQLNSMKEPYFIEIKTDYKPYGGEDFPPWVSYDKDLWNMLKEMCL
jgi:hypothetical protein